MMNPLFEWWLDLQTLETSNFMTYLHARMTLYPPAASFAAASSPMPELHPVMTCIAHKSTADQRL